MPRSRESYELDALGERIAALSAHIQAATYQLLVMIREFDQRDGWGGGFRSCAHWLNWRTGLNLGAAREKVRVARALAELPLISASMERGEISYSKVRALTRIASPKTEKELLAFARDGTASHVEKLVRYWRRVQRFTDAEYQKRLHESRYCRVYTDDDGMVIVRARLSPEAGEALERALLAASDKLYGVLRPPRDATRDENTGEQRRADAMGMLAESALAGGMDPGTRGDRYQVVVHVEDGDLESAPGVSAATSGQETKRLGEGETTGRNGDGDVSAETSGEPGRASTPTVGHWLGPPQRTSAATPATRDHKGLLPLDGVCVSAEASRRIACGAARVTMTHATDGSVLDVGRRTRAIPPALRRALTHRDGGCRFPGCGLELCDAHHVEHWADGGETKLDNLVQLCRHHHRAVHEEGFTVELLANGDVRFHRPNGMLIPEAPALPAAPADPTAALAVRLADQGITIDPAASQPTWEGYPCDYNMAIDWLVAMA